MYKYKKIMLHFLKPYACLIMLEVYISILDKLCFMMMSVPLFALFHLCIVQPYFYPLCILDYLIFIQSIR